MRIDSRVDLPMMLQRLVQCAVLCCAVVLSGPAWADDNRWTELKQTMFGTATITEDGNVIALEAPSRAHDAATVPIVMKALDDVRPVKKVHLIVDQNPVPLAGIFSFTDEAGVWRSLETRIRINEYTNVRAIAEMEDGSLHMAQSFVKASGGCSAPAMADMEAALARAGKMKVLLDKINDTDGEQRASAVIKISHPNNSGMQFDQISRNYIPAFFVHTIGAEINGKPLLSVETNFSMSENPVVRLEFSPQDADGELRVFSVDSKGGESEKITQFAGDYSAAGTSEVN